MIYPSLTDAQMKKSQKFYIGFNLLNGIGYLCVGEMIGLIIATLGFPDVIYTINGALFNIGCIWLPLGKIATSKWGAAKTQSNFWILRNLSALIMVSCVIWVSLGYIYIGGAFLLFGAFIFYGCRSAGGVMSTALVGNITDADGRGKLLAFASMAHNIVSAVIHIGLGCLMLYNPSIWILFGVVIFGAVCGILSAVCLRCIDESDAIMKAAKTPLIADAWSCLKDSGFRRMVIAQVCFSLSTALTFALNVLILKRGFNLPNGWIMLINFFGGLLYAAAARPASILGDKIGPRKAMIIGHSVMFFIIFFWQVVPAEFHWWSIALLLLMTSISSMCFGICSGMYFLRCIPVKHQPSAATLQQLINGVLTGFIAMGLTTLLWSLCDRYCADYIRIVETYGIGVAGMERYRFFFLLALPFVALGWIGIWSQKEV